MKIKKTAYFETGEIIEFFCGRGKQRRVIQATRGATSPCPRVRFSRAWERNEVRKEFVW